MKKSDMNLLRHILVCLLFFLPGHQLLAVETAQSVMDKVISTLQQSKSLTADYSAEIDGHTQKGVLTVCGDRFTLVSPSVACWFDGVTQWTYASSVGEVNITEPTPEEIGQVNPFAIIRNFKSGFSATILSSDPRQITLKLNAKNSKSEIRSVELTVVRTTSLPSKAILTLSTGQKIRISVSDIKSGQMMPVSAFRFDPAKLPGVPVVDLR